MQVQYIGEEVRVRWGIDIFDFIRGTCTWQLGVLRAGISTALLRPEGWAVAAAAQRQVLYFLNSLILRYFGLTARRRA
jgi:hypothetical protein